MQTQYKTSLIEQANTLHVLSNDRRSHDDGNTLPWALSAIVALLYDDAAAASIVALLLAGNHDGRLDHGCWIRIRIWVRLRTGVRIRLRIVRLSIVRGVHSLTTVQAVELTTARAYWWIRGGVSVRRPVRMRRHVASRDADCPAQQTTLAGSTGHSSQDRHRS